MYSASIKFWVLKTTVTILGEIISDYHKLQGILLLLINVGLLWVVVRNVPYYSSTINCFQGALYSLLTWQALILFPLVWDQSWAEVCLLKPNTSLVQYVCNMHAAMTTRKVYAALC